MHDSPYTFHRNPESGLTRAQQCGPTGRRGRDSTAAADAAVSYIKPILGRLGGAQGGGKHRGIIHLTERVGERARLCQTPEHLTTLSPPTNLKRNLWMTYYVSVHNSVCMQRVEADRANRGRPDAAMPDPAASCTIPPYTFLIVNPRVA